MSIDFLYQAPLRLVWSAFARWLSGSHFHTILDKQLKSWLCALCFLILQYVSSGFIFISYLCLLWYSIFCPSFFTLTSRSVLKTCDTSILGKHQLYWQENLQGLPWSLGTFKGLGQLYLWINNVPVRLIFSHKYKSSMWSVVCKNDQMCGMWCVAKQPTEWYMLCVYESSWGKSLHSWLFIHKWMYLPYSAFENLIVLLAPLSIFTKFLYDLSCWSSGYYI